MEPSNHLPDCMLLSGTDAPDVGRTVFMETSRDDHVSTDADRRPCGVWGRLAAQALLCVALLCKLHNRWLQLVCDSRVLMLVDRLQKDKEQYLHNCVQAFQATVVALVPTITDAISVVRLSSQHDVVPCWYLS